MMSENCEKNNCREGIPESERVLTRMQSRLFKSLAHPTRLQIVKQLYGGPRCVCELVEELGEEYANVSRHLAKLSSVGVVSSRRQGTNIFYSLKCQCILGFLGCLTEFIVKSEEDREKITCRITKD